MVKISSLPEIRACPRAKMAMGMAEGDFSVNYPARYEYGRVWHGKLSFDFGMRFHFSLPSPQKRRYVSELI